MRISKACDIINPELCSDNFGHRDDMDDPDVRMVYHKVEVFRKNVRAAGKL